MLSKLVKIVSLGSVIAGATIAPAAAQYRRQDYVVIWYTDENETTISVNASSFATAVASGSARRLCMKKPSITVAAKKAQEEIIPI